jgi:hypothetical protein
MDGLDLLLDCLKKPPSEFGGRFVAEPLYKGV